ncbi:hypothetical protein D9M71_766710 [compost metagenome]
MLIRIGGRINFAGVQQIPIVANKLQFITKGTGIHRLALELERAAAAIAVHQHQPRQVLRGISRVGDQQRMAAPDLAEHIDPVTLVSSQVGVHQELTVAA